eukprot:TRINITY_DN122120_c0_g1_i1.p1 TRINITY_DN122120_c0_g1~~TRINITY_DN122120_c0_g1_i1.p1  ORF type:complete len:164 (-),score=0.62 TRINITY_DN122120_c0_g1_i1:84-575(-)
MYMPMGCFSSYEYQILKSREPVNKRILMARAKTRNCNCMLVTACSPHSGYPDGAVCDMCNILCEPWEQAVNEKCVFSLGRDFNAPVGPKHGDEQFHGGCGADKDRNVRGDMLADWLTSTGRLVCGWSTLITKRSTSTPTYLGEPLVNSLFLDSYKRNRRIVGS